MVHYAAGPVARRAAGAEEQNLAGGASGFVRRSRGGFGDCGGCDRKGELLDRKGMRFPVRCSGPAGARTVYNPIPIYMGDRLKELPVELPLLYFTIETAARVREVLALVREGLPFDGPFTRGLYYKGTN